MFELILENVKSINPLVHSITNYVTVNDCANIILASGGAPIMADDIDEVCDITSICSSLVINMGTLNERTINSMIVAGRKANELSHPVIFDPVGAGASGLRNKTANRLLKEIKFSVIRGNISEIKFLAGENGNTHGVDAALSDIVDAENIGRSITFVKNFAKSIGSVIAVTGAVDIVSDGIKSYIISNGHPMMSRVTGTGCMLTSVIGSYCGANYNNILDASAAAVTVMGLCGELAHKRLMELDGGTNSYRMLLIDYISKIDSTILKEGAKIECK